MFPLVSSDDYVMSTQRKNASRPKAQVSKSVYAGQPEAVFKKGMRQHKAGSKRASGRAHSKGSDRSHANTQVTFFNPRGTNQVLPREYLTKLKSRYQGEFATASFGAGTGALTAFTLEANNLVTPWVNMVATWMNAATPATLPQTNFKTLCSAPLYNSCIVLATKWEFIFASPETTANNSFVVTMTPVINAASAPNTVTLAEKQPFTKVKLVQNIPTNQDEARVSIYMNWAEFIGTDPMVYAADLTGVYSNNVTPAGVYAQPAVNLPIVFNMNCMDQLPPSLPIPFEMITTHYVKFFDFTDGLITP